MAALSGVGGRQPEIKGWGVYGHWNFHSQIIYVGITFWHKIKDWIDLSIIYVYMWFGDEWIYTIGTNTLYILKLELILYVLKLKIVKLVTECHGIKIFFRILK